MKNFRKIAKVLVTAVFFCTFIGISPKVYAADDEAAIQKAYNDYKSKVEQSNALLKKYQGTPCTTAHLLKNNGDCYEKASDGNWYSKNSSTPLGSKGVKLTKPAYGSIIGVATYDQFKATYDDAKQKKANEAAGIQDCVPACGPTQECKCTAAGCKCMMSSSGVSTTNTPQKAGSASGKGCSASGIFSGLVCKGAEIFKGLRDLIYVVAGFGIIGVAVGGFFGNLNWKWLGAIIIGLVVIATTGEIINAIAGQNITSGMITDTLK